VETAAEMREVVLQALPADVFVAAAAVGDWRMFSVAEQKLKKTAGAAPVLELAVNPDILAEVAGAGERRPRLVVGFAAETEALVAQAREKRVRKGCDWVLANGVGSGSDVMGGGENAVTLVTGAGEEVWPRMSKVAVAERLVGRIGDWFADHGAA
jgi:phosphopantothenoylcysteine decarboxylase/phosphopantothenate--cysteine ligase